MNILLELFILVICLTAFILGPNIFYTIVFFHRESMIIRLSLSFSFGVAFIIGIGYLLFNLDIFTPQNTLLAYFLIMAILNISALVFLIKKEDGFGNVILIIYNHFKRYLITIRFSATMFIVLIAFLFALYTRLRDPVLGGKHIVLRQYQYSMGVHSPHPTLCQVCLPEH